MNDVFEKLFSSMRQEFDVLVQQHQTEVKRQAQVQLTKRARVLAAMASPAPTLLTCEICGVTFDSVKLLLQHISREHKIDMDQDIFQIGSISDFECEICGQVFTSIKKRRLHQRTDHNQEKPFSCKECGARFSLAHSLTTHARSHSGEKPFACDICHKTFSDVSNRRRHQRIHSGKKPYHCALCDMSFSRLYSIERHNKRAHLDLNLPPLGIGDATAASSAAVPFVLADTPIISGPSPSRPVVVVNSPAAPVRAAAAASGTGHPPGPPLLAQPVAKPQSDDTGQANKKKKWFPCDICGAVLSRSDSLLVHKRGHSGERPFQCKECGKSFSESGSLLVHSRTHSGERPFVCELCGKAYPESGKLSIHMRTHTGEKRHQCSECGKVFQEAARLKRHQKLHDSRDKMHTCTVCNKSFTEAYKLTAHVLTPKHQRNMWRSVLQPPVATAVAIAPPSTVKKPNPQPTVASVPAAAPAVPAPPAVAPAVPVVVAPLKVVAKSST